MNIQRAIEVLSRSTRQELRDHAFGDVEIYWVDYNIPGEHEGGTEVGFAYIGGPGKNLIHVTDPVNGDKTDFGENDFRALRNLGSSVRIDRNDETGPDRFEEGRCMPALTLEGVRAELTETPLSRGSA